MHMGNFVWKGCWDDANVSCIQVTVTGNMYTCNCFFFLCTLNYSQCLGSCGLRTLFLGSTNASARPTLATARHPTIPWRSR